MAKVRYIPEGSHTITAGLTVKDARKAIDFYKKAFGATEIGVMTGPDGSVMHAELKLGDSKFFLGEESPEWGNKSPQTLSGTPVSLHAYFEDCDSVYKRAVDAGAQGAQPPADMFWGDRYGQVIDPFGHRWGILTHKEDVPFAESERRGKEWMAQMAQAAKK